MSVLALNSLGSLRSFAPLILRIVTGLIMFLHGWAKFQSGAAGVGGFFGSLGIPAPETMAYVVMTVEMVCGIMLMLGLLTRISAILLLCVLVTVLFTAKAEGSITGGEGPTKELEMSLAAACTALILMGAGKFSIDRALGWSLE